MIYILSGVAKSGKTTMAKEFTKRYKIPYFSTDYIMMMLNRGNPILGIDPESSDEVISEKLEPYVYGMIKTMIENKAEYLIEGVHFNPDFASKLIKEFPNDVNIVYLGYKDTSVNLKVYELNKYKDVLENAGYSYYSNKKLEDYVTYLILESKKTFILCEAFKLQYIEVYDLNSQLNEILDSLKE